VNSECVSQSGMSEGILRIQPNRTFKTFDTSQAIKTCGKSEVMLPFQERLMCDCLDGLADLARRFHFLNNSDLHGRGKRACDLLLKSKYVVQIAIKSSRPQHRPMVGTNQTNSHPNVAGLHLNGTLQHMIELG